MQPNYSRLLGLTLLMAAGILFLRTLECQFVNWDDDRYVVENPPVRAGLSWQGAQWALTTGHASNWHPLTWFSHMLDYHVWGPNPRGHHATSLVLHAINVFLLFRLLHRSTNRPWRSALVAALFAVHPLHVESVAWISERKDVLSTFFWLLALGCYLRYVNAPAADRRQRRICYAGTLLAFAASLASKPMAVTLPFLLLLLDYWPLNRWATARPATASGTRLVREKWPLFLLSAVSCGVTLAVQHAGGAVASFAAISFWSRLGNAALAYAGYLHKTVWPQGLCAFYPYPEQFRSGSIVLAVLALSVISVGAIRWRTRWPYLFVGWFWFVGTLIPVIGLVQVGEQAMADRYTYVSLVGLFIAAAWALGDCVSARPGAKPYAVIGAAAGLVLCAVVSYRQIGFWQDGVTLFTRVVQVTRPNATAHNVLGLALLDRDAAAAGQQFRTALELNPHLSPAHNNLAMALWRLGQREEAVRHYRLASQLNPEDPEPHFNLANAFNPGFAESGVPAPALPAPASSDLELAEREYGEALRLCPDHFKAHLNWGNLKMARQEPAAALALYEKALRLDPTSWAGLYNVASALARLGRPGEALDRLEHAGLRSERPLELQLLHANLLASQGRFDAAIPAYERILGQDPQRHTAWNDLGSALARAGRMDEAAIAYLRAVAVNPAYAEAQLNLGTLRARETRYEEAETAFNAAMKARPEDARAPHQLGLLFVKLDRLEEALPLFTRAVSLAPENLGLRCDLGLAYAKLGEYSPAVEQYEAALKLQPDFVLALNNLAWLLATAPEATARNGNRSLVLAQHACELTGRKDPMTLGTLDAACAEAGDFALAVETAMQTYRLANDSGRTEIADAALARLKFYWEKKPWHQSPPSRPRRLALPLNP